MLSLVWHTARNKKHPVWIDFSDNILLACAALLKTQISLDLVQAHK